MTAFQTLTFVPLDGTLSITLPESLRGKKVSLYAEPERRDEPEDALTLYFEKMESMESMESMSDEEFSELLCSLPGIQANRPQKSREEHLAWVESIQGTLHSVDYSDLRDETDREL